MSLDHIQELDKAIKSASVCMFLQQHQRTQKDIRQEIVVHQQRSQRHIEVASYLNLDKRRMKMENLELGKYIFW